METIKDKNLNPVMVCPACGSTDWKLSGQTKDYSITGEWFELNECVQCHLKATHPQPDAKDLGRYYSSKEYISHSDTNSGITNKLFHRARNFMMKKKYHWVSKAADKTSGNLLDIGAGTGYFAKYMHDHGWNVTALEPDETARKVAAEKLKIQLLSLDELPDLIQGSYDVITLWHVLEHVHDVTGYMNHFRSLLKPNGIIVIAVPNYTSRDAEQYGPQWAAYDVPRHLWHFSPASIEKLLVRHGFKLFQKITMPLDAFYVSMLSEKYRGNYFLGPLAAFISGLRTLFSEKKNVNRASSIIYVAR
ncbi:MAG TPA: class I SAM-dependent methyltransferase [Saprospiraceae bacterium]|nr:class I SAM-dependent methyltransferase [Saprospiraceae bacterium]